MASTPHASRSIRAMLRATTRTPLFVPPQGWGLEHLELLRVQIAETTSSPPPPPPPPPHCAELRHFPAGDKKLDFFVRSRDQNVFLIRLLHRMIWPTGLFRVFCANPSMPLGFCFGTRSYDLLDATVITRNLGSVALPVLSYIARVRIAEIRRPNRRAARVPLDAQMDPYEFAILVTMAQKQHAVLRILKCPRQSYTTHLIACIPRPRGPRFVLFTATIPVGFLRCLRKPDVPLLPADAPSISRYSIPRKTSGPAFLDIIYGALATGPFMGQPEWRKANRRLPLLRAKGFQHPAETAAPSKPAKRSADDMAEPEEGSRARNPARTIKKLKMGGNDILEDKENTPPETMQATEDLGPPTRKRKRNTDAISGNDCTDDGAQWEKKPKTTAHATSLYDADERHSPAVEPGQSRVANDTPATKPTAADIDQLVAPVTVVQAAVSEELGVRLDTPDALPMKKKRTADEMGQPELPETAKLDRPVRQGRYKRHRSW
ncbi:hypothetical protein FN846DRAFT_906768 [Sphaerosporella brunnea]|uniref:Uncharacterized protein n=1 Tax=Sphaerosporella brunnea TaxID=1250544 RepID=A0A5J5EXX6_9PEZI|nr:hypothetical protein FN846DRAFT_906768 [Sphaerosporella brunnea]